MIVVRASFPVESGRVFASFEKLPRSARDPPNPPLPDTQIPSNPDPFSAESSAPVIVCPHAAGVRKGAVDHAYREGTRAIRAAVES